MSTPLTAVSGIGPAAAGLLEKHGIASAEQLAQVTVEELSEVPGFGTSRATTVIAAARAALDAPAASEGGKAKGKKKDKKGKKDRKKKKQKKEKKEKKRKPAAAEPEKRGKKKDKKKKKKKRKGRKKG